MQDRLQKLLDSEQLTPAKFAEIIGVQRSAISHILTGRNKPSFDLINKIVHKFPALSSDWLITGKGNMYKTVVQRSLFDFDDTSKKDISAKINSLNPAQSLITDVTSRVDLSDSSSNTSVEVNRVPSKMVKKIVVFYTDNTFEEFITAP